MTDLALKLSAVLERLPVAVALFSSTGHLLGKAGGMSSVLGRMAPPFSPSEARRWSFKDKTGADIPRTEWPSARALRGESHYDGMVGTLHVDEDIPVKVISLPVSAPGSDVAAVSFVQVLDTRTRSAFGSHLDVQQKLIDALARAIADSWRDLEPTMIGRCV